MDKPGGHNFHQLVLYQQKKVANNPNSPSIRFQPNVQAAAFHAWCFSTTIETGC